MSNANAVIEILKSKLVQRKRLNPSYSLRSFARDLGVNSGSLSSVLAGKRSLSTELVQSIANKLNLSREEYEYFLGRKEIDDRFLVDQSHFCVLSEWEHFAVLELSELFPEGFDENKAQEIFGISMARTREVFANLLVAKLIRKNAQGLYEAVHIHLKTSDDLPSRALKLSHLETLDLAKDKLESTPLEHRNYSSMTIALGAGDVEKVKDLAAEFRAQVKKTVQDSKKDKVYQLAIQLFPLSELEWNEIEEHKNV